ncbi:transglycosylase family protein [Streptomyces sp. L2]|uniref:LysM peptidoglycan-binding domain-containing protein n=1 Tax=Streptomyces sp. L2 TaxID=2162665 RepID=UPI0010110E88|nr:transglycosylase family protein [Streptomyces sp. L2]
MLSGNGRHRRPRQAPAILVAAGVTGSALALPLLGAASAHAADGTTWDKVAECESGGSWSANPGNGYYGGLQMSQEDWDKYGGDQYASSPDLASRSQQIAVAEKILDDQGTTPWATCALLSGLTSDSGSVTVDPGSGGSGGSADAGDSSGTTGSGDSAGTSDSSGLPDSPSSSDSGSPATPGSGTGTGSDAGSGTGSSTTPSPDAGKDSGTGSDADSGSGTPSASDGAGGSDGDNGGTNTPKSDKSASSDPGTSQGDDSASTATPGSGDSDNSWQSGSSWSLVDTGALSSGGRHRGDSADESVTNGQDDASSGRHASRDASTYTVREGDTLASIADSLDVDGGWHALYATNKKAIGTDPNHIAPGQTLRVGA